MSELADALQAQRIELAGEVHDRIIPPLFAARMQLEALAARLTDAKRTAAEPPGAAQPASRLAAEIEQAAGLIRQAIATSRQLLAELAPHEPGEQHWNTQLRQAVGDRDIMLQQVGNLPWERIAPETAITLSSIACEAIRNAVRHGQPRRITVTLERIDQVAGDETSDEATPEICRIVIHDDGRGFDPTQASSHHGLHLMRLRATSIGAELNIASRPGGPSEVSLRLPLPH